MRQVMIFIKRHAERDTRNTDLPHYRGNNGGVLAIAKQQERRDMSK
jgi:hypothetical protein